MKEFKNKKKVEQQTDIEMTGKNLDTKVKRRD